MTKKNEKIIRLVRNKGLMIGGIILLLLTLIALTAPVISPYDPNITNLQERLVRPFSESKIGNYHVFGTDSLGRDLLSRIIYGTRISLLVGLFGSIGAGLVGVTLGAIAGYYGRHIDSIIMRATDIGLSIPFVLLAMSVSLVLGSGLANVILVLSVTGWMNFARVTRGAAMKIRKEQYIEAATVYNCPSSRIIFRQMIPNLIAPIIVICSQQFGVMIYSEATLSFLGFGVPVDVPTWGRMISDGQAYISNYWWISTIPGIVLTITVIAAFLFGDGLRDYLDPKLSE